MATEVTHGSVKRVIFSWTGSTAGAASETTSAPFDGEVILLATVPSTATAPSANYDIVVNDSDSVGILAGAGANRSSSATEFVQPTSLGAVSPSLLSLAVSNAGTGGAGAVHVWIR